LNYHRRRRRYKNIDVSAAGCDGCDSSCAVVAASGVISGFAPGSRYVV